MAPDDRLAPVAIASVGRGLVSSARLKLDVEPTLEADRLRLCPRAGPPEEGADVRDLPPEDLTRSVRICL